jgi:putative ABC transport system ATP-binding protein
MLRTLLVQYAHPGGRLLYYPDVHVARGDALLMTGPSGCGKTTWLHLVAGLLQARGGQFWIDDQRLTPDRVALVPQVPHLLGSLTVMQNLAAASFAARRSFDGARAEHLLDAVGLSALAARRPAELSRGQAQRVALARALMNQPDVLLADEPTASLDDESAAAAIKLLVSQAKAAGAALVIASHDGRVKPLFDATLALPGAEPAERAA